MSLFVVVSAVAVLVYLNLLKAGREGEGRGGREQTHRLERRICSFRQTTKIHVEGIKWSVQSKRRSTLS